MVVYLVDFFSPVSFPPKSIIFEQLQFEVIETCGEDTLVSVFIGATPLSYDESKLSLYFQFACILIIVHIFICWCQIFFFIIFSKEN